MKKLFVFFILAFHFLSASAQYFLYGMTANGGIYDKGVIFKFNPFSGKDTAVFSFDGLNGQEPNSSLMQASDGKFYSETEIGGTDNDGVLFGFNPETNIENVLINFNRPNGNWAGGGGTPYEGKNGNLYATTFLGGKYNYGIIFKYNIYNYKDSVVSNFDSLDGYGPCRNFIYDSNTKLLYGVTEYGGNKNYGVVYSFDTATDFENILIDFNGLNGNQSIGSLCKANNGLFYGMTAYGGTNNIGVVYVYNPLNNKDTVILNFNDTNGGFANGNNLFQATNGLLYGMTYFGGINDNGILFDINPLTNIEKVLVRFNDTNGMNPLGTVVEDSARGLLFGMTALGGKYNDGVIFSYNINTGKDSILLNFDGSNGRVLLADLLMVKDSSTGINEIRNDVAGVKLYPNPSNGIFTVALCHPELVSGSQTIGVYNVMGQKVYYGMLNRVQHDYNIDLSSKPGGIYFYRVTSVDGSLVREGKLIIQK